MLTPPERQAARRRAQVVGDPNCTPITLRDKGVAVHRDDVDVPEILFAGSVGVVTAIPAEPYDAGDIGENQTSVRVVIMLARSG
jgi:hypothetical protein